MGNGAIGALFEDAAADPGLDRATPGGRFPHRMGQERPPFAHAPQEEIEGQGRRQRHGQFVADRCDQFGFLPLVCSMRAAAWKAASTSVQKLSI
ncbi:hypothetical protein D3C72_2290500 [compost metagenome]